MEERETVRSRIQRSAKRFRAMRRQFGASNFLRRSKRQFGTLRGILALCEAFWHVEFFCRGPKGILGHPIFFWHAAGRFGASKIFAEVCRAFWRVGGKSGGLWPRRAGRIRRFAAVRHPASRPGAACKALPDELVFILEENSVRVLTPKEGIRRAQALVRSYIPEGRSLSDELIEERQRITGPGGWHFQRTDV